VFRTLILGRSNLDFTEPGLADASVPTLLESRLRAEAPEFEHELVTASLYFGDRMASRAAEVIEREQPDATFVQIGTNSIEEEFVVWSIQTRWPKLYPFALTIAQALKSAAGGGPEGADSARGELFRLPRAFARKVFGAEAGNDLEEALRCTLETVDALARFEDRGVAMQLLPVVRDRPLPSAQKRLDYFSRALTARCEKRHVRLLSRFDYCREMGVVPQPSGHGIYPGRVTREADVRAMTSFILETAGVKQAAV
jgi:hypothetical protein